MVIRTTIYIFEVTNLSELHKFKKLFKILPVHFPPRVIYIKKKTCKKYKLNNTEKRYLPSLPLIIQRNITVSPITTSHLSEYT